MQLPKGMCINHPRWAGRSRARRGAQRGQRGRGRGRRCWSSQWGGTFSRDNPIRQDLGRETTMRRTAGWDEGQVENPDLSYYGYYASAQAQDTGSPNRFPSQRGYGPRLGSYQQHGRFTRGTPTRQDLGRETSLMRTAGWDEGQVENPDLSYCGFYYASAQAQDTGSPNRLSSQGGYGPRLGSYQQHGRFTRGTPTRQDLGRETTMSRTAGWDEGLVENPDLSSDGYYASAQAQDTGSPNRLPSQRGYGSRLGSYQGHGRFTRGTPTRQDLGRETTVMRTAGWDEGLVENPDLSSDGYYASAQAQDARSSGHDFWGAPSYSSDMTHQPMYGGSGRYVADARSQYQATPCQEGPEYYHREKDLQQTKEFEPSDLSDWRNTPDHKGDSRPCHLQEKKIIHLVGQACFFLLYLTLCNLAN